MRIWGYGGRVPGETLRLRQGEQLRRTLINELPQSTTIHWHGLCLPNAMDGVGYMTQDPVAPGASFDYDYTLRDAGKYWYHPHQQTCEQMARGLCGALIVEEPEGPRTSTRTKFCCWMTGG
jgi:FtsP/CotA-like multicopper oxidase with cupredoxin domain